MGEVPPKTSEESYWGGEHYWISPAELNASKYICSTSRTITDAGVKSAHLQLLPIGTVLLSSRAPIGKVAITKVPMYCNQGFKNLICGNTILNEYAYWFLYHSTEYLNSLGTGATFKEISKKTVEQIPIPLPPLPEQEKIVAELDCLSGIIEKKKQQLKELDALAQSIFYEMFGDPVENEKGWEVKNVGEVCEDKKAIIRANKFFKNDDVIQYIDIASVNNNINIIESTTSFRFEDAPSRAQQVVNCGDILISLVRPNLRNIAVVQFNDNSLVASSGFCVLRVGPNIDYLFLKHILLTDSFTTYLMDRVAGANYPAVREEDIKKCSISVPPLSLQHSFASKVEAIEKQKELIKQSIAETELLFNSRMQYYFG